MTIINETTVVVFNSSELRTVLEGNNTYTLIYFGDNIKLQTGIAILPTKTNIVIDGTYNSVRYTYEDMNSTAAGSTIAVRTASSVKVTVQNMDIIGHNYYGVICVYDSTSLSGVETTYINVDYVGPQMVYNAYGTTRFIDCDIRIQASTSPANEVGEFHKLEIGGNTNIHHSGSTLSTFWFRGGLEPYLKILPDSDVVIESSTSYMNYIDGSRNLIITFGMDSKSDIKMAHGMSASGHEISQIIIDNNAEVTIEQSERFGVNPTCRLRNGLTMNSKSSLKMICDYPLINTTNYNILFTQNNAQFNLNNPNSLVLYNSATEAVHSNFTTQYNFNISQFNRWTTLKPVAQAGDIYDIPTYSWYKLENTDNFNISGNITSTQTTISSNNFSAGELTELPALTNFTFRTTRLLSIGRPSLTINPITDELTEMSGTTVPNSDVRITYDGNDYYVVTDGTGNFIHTYPIPLPEGTNISFVSNLAHTFLYRFRTVQINFAGDLSIIYATKTVTFDLTPIQLEPTICPRNSELKVVVNDSRLIKTNWKLYASIPHDLESIGGSILPDSLILTDGTLANFTVLSDTPTLVYTETNPIEERTIEWVGIEGILLQLNIVPLKIGEIYRTDINWIIEE